MFYMSVLFQPIMRKWQHHSNKIESPSLTFLTSVFLGLETHTSSKEMNVKQKPQYWEAYASISLGGCYGS